MNASYIRSSHFRYTDLINMQTFAHRTYIFFTNEFNYSNRQGGGFAEATVRVHVLDRNEFPPRLERTEYRGVISEASPPGTLVSELPAESVASRRLATTPLVLRTLDEDSVAHRRRSYRILDPDAARLFAVDPVTGALTIRARLDRETAASHSFRVRVLDAGSPRLASSSSAEIVVIVLDANDTPPRFSRQTYETTLSRPTVAGVAVLALSATDPDETGETLEYDVVDGDETGAFSIDETGTLLVRRPDDLADSYRLRVRVSDGEFSTTARVRVDVKDLADAGFSFRQTDYYASAVENETRPTTVAALTIVGAALDEHVEFRIANPGAPFAIGRTSGVVRTTGGPPLDRETATAHELLVEAHGAPGPNGEPRIARARLHVTVTDVNDNCPTFVELPYAGAVEAGAAPGTRVLAVRAVDADVGDNGDVRYEMKRGHGELFRVDRRTGLVSLKQTPDSRDEPHRLVIAAFDGGERVRR